MVHPIAGVIIILILGAVCAWSVFKIPLMNMHGWDGKTVQYTFMILMGIVGLAAAFGSTLVDKKGSGLLLRSAVSSLVLAL